MDINEIRMLFATDFSDPGSEQSGAYLYEHALKRAEIIIEHNREGLIEVVSEWLAERNDPITMLAVFITKKLNLYELVNEIKGLREDVINGKIFYPDYLLQIDRCIDTITRGSVANNS